MNSRIMLKASRSSYALDLHTVPGPPGGSKFFLLPDECRKLLTGSRLVTRSGNSFAEFYPDGPIMHLRFTWLRETDTDCVSGTSQALTLDRSAFLDILRDEEPGEHALLSLPPASMPKLDFSKAENTLRRITADPALRRAFVRSLRRSFGWPGADRIRFYSDWDPVSFTFVEEREGGRAGISGGFICHRENVPYIRWQVHT